MSPYKAGFAQTLNLHTFPLRMRRALNLVLAASTIAFNERSLLTTNALVGHGPGRQSCSPEGLLARARAEFSIKASADMTIMPRPKLAPACLPDRRRRRRCCRRDSQLLVFLSIPHVSQTYRSRSHSRKASVPQPYEGFFFWALRGGPAHMLVERQASADHLTRSDEPSDRRACILGVPRADKPRPHPKHPKLGSGWQITPFSTGMMFLRRSLIFGTIMVWLSASSLSINDKMKDM